MLTFIGFGEAGMAFAGTIPARGYDRSTDHPDTRSAKLADFAAAGVVACNDPGAAMSRATAIFSLVTADQALAAAHTAAAHIETGALWFDMNSVAPDTSAPLPQ